MKEEDRIGRLECIEPFSVYVHDSAVRPLFLDLHQQCKFYLTWCTRSLCVLLTCTIFSIWVGKMNTMNVRNVVYEFKLRCSCCQGCYAWFDLHLVPQWHLLMKIQQPTITSRGHVVTYCLPTSFSVVSSSLV